MNVSEANATARLIRALASDPWASRPHDGAEALRFLHGRAERALQVHLPDDSLERAQRNVTDLEHATDCGHIAIGRVFTWLVIAAAALILLFGLLPSSEPAPVRDLEPLPAPTTTDASSASSGGTRIVSRAPAEATATARREPLAVFPLEDDTCAPFADPCEAP